METAIDKRGADMWEQLYIQASESKRAALARAREAERVAAEIEADYQKMKRRYAFALCAMASVLNIVFWVMVLA